MDVLAKHLPTEQEAQPSPWLSSRLYLLES